MADVQRGLISLEGATTSDEITLGTPVPVGESYVISSVRSNQFCPSRSLVQMELTTIDDGKYTKLKATRDTGGTNSNAYVEWQVVTGNEFTVQSGETDFDGGTTNEHTATIDAVDLGEAFIVLSKSTSSTQFDRSFTCGRFNSTTQIRLNVDLTTTMSYPDVCWYVVEWDQASVQSGLIEVDGESLVTSDITTVDLDKTLLSYLYTTESALNAKTAFLRGRIETWDDNGETKHRTEFRRNTGSGKKDLVYYVITHDKLVVQSGLLTESGTTATITLSSLVNVGQALMPTPVIGNNWAEPALSGDMRDSTTQKLWQDGDDSKVAIQRHSSSGDMHVCWFVGEVEDVVAVVNATATALGIAPSVTAEAAISVQVNSPVATVEADGIAPVITAGGVQSDAPVTDGLVLALDANAIEGLNNDDPIQTWEDLSGEGNDATQATEENRPLYKTNVLNGKPVVRFDGTDDYFSVGTGWNFANYTVFVISINRVAITTETDRYGIFGIGADADRRFTLQYGGFNASAKISLITSGTADNRVYKTGTLSAGDARLITTEWHGTKLNLRVSGEAVDDLTISSPNIVSGDEFRIGQRIGNAFTNELNGDVAEILTYNRALTNEEREEVEQYLGVKWLGWEAEQNVAISAPTATATCEAITPAIIAEAVVSVTIATPIATATSEGLSPSVYTEVYATVIPPPGEADTEAIAPSIITSKTVAISTPVATMEAESITPEVSASKVVSITVLVATAESEAIAPSITTRTVINATVDAPIATATAETVTPELKTTRSVSVTTPTATATAQGITPVVGTAIIVSIDIDAPIATAEAQGIAPEISTTKFVSIDSPTATALSAGIAPEVEKTSNITVETPTAEADAQGVVPQIYAQTVGTVSISAVVAEVDADGIAPTVTATQHTEIDSPIATATAEGIAPSVTAQTVATADIAAPTAEVDTEGIAPVITITVTGAVVVNAPIAEADAEGIAPSVDVTRSIGIEVPTAEANAEAIAPSVTSGIVVEVTTPTAEATAEATAPSVTTTINATITPPVAEAEAIGVIPTVTAVAVNAVITAPTAEAQAAGVVPEPVAVVTVRQRKGRSLSIIYNVHPMKLLQKNRTKKVW